MKKNLPKSSRMNNEIPPNVVERMRVLANFMWDRIEEDLVSGKLKVKKEKGKIKVWKEK